MNKVLFVLSVWLVFTSTHQRWWWGEDLSIGSVSSNVEVKSWENLWSSWFQSQHSESSGLTLFVNRLHTPKFASGLVDLCISNSTEKTQLH